jgi:hypothetical protein
LELSNDSSGESVIAFIADVDAGEGEGVGTLSFPIVAGDLTFGEIVGISLWSIKRLLGIGGMTGTASAGDKGFVFGLVSSSPCRMASRLNKLTAPDDGAWQK